ncbi:phosphorylcholine transferase LicD [uncultured Methanobrevibacter sp.]|uniref:LicD family protein n=1 Tax=uncultured Methanobrevibacter sp. TaxID=253161 RepID=UPI0025EAA3AC|nr:LicD family protein [uncultured Methanobrevibacter sp.]
MKSSKIIIIYLIWGGDIINAQDNVKLKMLNAFETQMNHIFLKYNNQEISFEETMNYLNKYLYLLNFSRFDLKNVGDENNSINIIKYNPGLNFWFPDWFDDDYGRGCQLEYPNETVKLNVQCERDGNFSLQFRGVDFKNLDNQRIPLYVNFEKIFVNRNKVNYVPQLVWHDEIFQYSKFCQDDEIIDIKIESKTMVDYYPQLKNFFKDIGGSSELNKEFLNVFQFIIYAKLIIQQRNDEKLLTQHEDNGDNVDMKLLITHLSNELYCLQKDFEEYKFNTDNIINAHYELFNTQFIYHNYEAKGLLKCNHILNQELLNFVANICNKYDLEYWLDFGLLLGAIRHGGFIPWDDDADIGMMREDYDIFLDNIKDEIDNHGLTDVLRISLNVNFYKPYPILQLLYYCKEVPDTIIGGMDIFPYDFIDDISNCNLYTYRSVRNSVVNNNRNGVPIGEALGEYYDKFNLSYGNKKYIISGIEGGRGTIPGLENIIFETEDIFPLKKARFENEEYLIPNNPNKFLSETYGDYLNIPRLPYHHQGRYDHLRKREDGLDIFKNNIIKMKKVNESYHK